MSGGSWDYLCYKEADVIENYTSDLKEMGDRLVKDGYPEIGKRFYDFIDELKIMTARKQQWLAKFSPIMRAIEWEDSGDTGHEQTKKICDEFIKELRGASEK